MWTKVLYDLNLIGFDEPYRKLVNQGMITGVSEFIYRYNPDENPESKFMGTMIPYLNVDISNLFSESLSPAEMMAKGEAEFYFSHDAIPNGEENKFDPRRVYIGYVDANKLNVEELVKNETKYAKAFFITKEGFYFKEKWYNLEKEVVDKQSFSTSSAGEKMSKSKLNTQNPDELCNKYGADTFRMYEMFLGPVEMSKPWDTKGIEGVHRFLKKFWRLFADETKGLIVADAEPTTEELKALHNAIRRIEQDTERFSFNTGVSSFMIATNELTDLKCHKRKILEPLLILLTPYAPHICEELWSLMGNKASILDASFPHFEEKYVKESSKAYPVAINGKTRTELTLALDITQQQVEEVVLQNEVVQKWLEGKQPKKIIYVKNKMINVVV